MKRFAIVAVCGALSVPSAAQAQSSFFDVFVEVSAGPPYPTAPNGVRVYNGSPGAMSPTGDIGMGLRSFTVDTVPPPAPLQASVRARNGAPGPGGFHIDSFFDVFTDISLAPPGGNVRGFFDVFADFTDIGGAGLRATPSSPPAFTSSFFDIFVEMDVSYLGGTTQSLHFRGETAPGVQINPGSHAAYPIDSFFDIFFDITYDRQVYNPQNPALTIRMTGTIPSPGAALVLGLGSVVVVRRRRSVRP